MEGEGKKGGGKLKPALAGFVAGRLSKGSGSV